MKSRVVASAIDLQHETKQLGPGRVGETGAKERGSAEGLPAVVDQVDQAAVTGDCHAGAATGKMHVLQGEALRGAGGIFSKIDFHLGGDFGGGISSYPSRISGHFSPAWRR